MDPKDWNMTGEATAEDVKRFSRARRFRQSALDPNVYELLDNGGKVVGVMRWTVHPWEMLAIGKNATRDSRKR